MITKQLKRNYALSIVQDMDTEALMEFAYERIYGELDALTDSELLAEITEYYPDLIK